MDDVKKSLGTADIARIMACLPHRYPFLMIDKVRDIDGEDSCIGIKNVTINEPHFIGHFPERPVMPGVLLIEGMAQTAGALCVIGQTASQIDGQMGGQTATQIDGQMGGQADERPKLVYLMTIDNAKFRKPVVPGDTVEYHVRKVRRRANIWKFAAEARVEGVKVAEAQISAMLVDG